LFYSSSVAHFRTAVVKQNYTKSPVQLFSWFYFILPHMCERFNRAAVKLHTVRSSKEWKKALVLEVDRRPQRAWCDDIKDRAAWRSVFSSE